MHAYSSCKNACLKKFNALYKHVQAIVKQQPPPPPPHILEQIENLLENVAALVEETKTLDRGSRRCRRRRYCHRCRRCCHEDLQLFEESYEDLKHDYFFILKVLKNKHKQTLNK
jgi:hypothetical protein